MPARVKRITVAILKSAKFVAGIIRWRKPSKVKILLSIPRKKPVSPRPDTGNQPSKTENTIIIIRPNQKVGIEMPRIEPPIIRRVPQAEGFNPAYNPRGRPIIMAIISADVASSRVAGKRSIIRARAGLPNTKELPRSPDIAPVRNFQYCTYTG